MFLPSRLGIRVPHGSPFYAHVLSMADGNIVNVSDARSVLAMCAILEIHAFDTASVFTIET